MLAERVLDIIAVGVGEYLVLSGRDITERAESERRLALQAQLLILHTTRSWSEIPSTAG